MRRHGLLLLLLIVGAAIRAEAQAPLTDRVIAEIQKFAKGTAIPIPIVAQGKRMVITSARGQIAWRTPKEGTNARYTPPAELRSDVVFISCGDSELGAIFECSRVRVRLVNKREIKPLSYAAQPSIYHNGFGAQWTVRTVAAIYPAPELRDGFLVDYASFDGTEWTVEVSSAEAVEILLLKCGDSGADKCGQKVEQRVEQTVEEVEEQFGKFALGPSANVRSMAIPTPKGSVAYIIHAGPPDAITIWLAAATTEELREFYEKALPRYHWQPERNECWLRSHPLSGRPQRLCIDFSSPNAAIVRITESQ